jgi:hypothetical protein
VADEPDQEQQPTQRTPKGLKIPVPTREDVMAAIRKVSEPTDETTTAEHGVLPDT